MEQIKPRGLRIINNFLLCAFLFKTSHTTCVILAVGEAFQIIVCFCSCFFLACEDFGRMFDHSFPACPLPPPFFFFFEVEISLRTLIPLFYARIGPQWLSELRRLWPNVPCQVACELPHYAWTAAQSAHSDIVASRMYACLGVPYHLRFWQNDRGLLRAIVVTRGWHGHRIRVTTQS